MRYYDLHEIHTPYSISHGFCALQKNPTAGVGGRKYPIKKESSHGLGAKQTIGPPLEAGSSKFRA
jgi:hypothetical protein